MHFGLRGRQEHHDMMVEDFSIEKDDDGVEFIPFSEGPTKTRQGGLRVKPRLATPKMFATGKKRCPVVLFKQYLEKTPSRNEENGGHFTWQLSTNLTPAPCGTRKHRWARIQ